MSKTALVITSIAGDTNPVLMQYAKHAQKRKIKFLVMGDVKSPIEFKLAGCSFYSLDRQAKLKYKLAGLLPTRHYGRKNLGYLLAMEGGAEMILETDDDNLPKSDFWKKRKRRVVARWAENKAWLNIYKYFSEKNVWPRGFALDWINKKMPKLRKIKSAICPIQQGLVDRNPDVDAIFRLTQLLPVSFEKREGIAVGKKTWCPFNSQNTVWFREAFMLMYLPVTCSFRMTDIWRSLVAQRIAWENGWKILFHTSDMRQKRNGHHLLTNFKDEIDGYMMSGKVGEELQSLRLVKGRKNIAENMKACYGKLIEMKIVEEKERELLAAWIEDAQKYC